MTRKFVMLVALFALLITEPGQVQGQENRVYESEKTVWFDPLRESSGERGETYQLTNSQDGCYNLANYHAQGTGFSPDGRYLLFVSNRIPNRRGLFLIDFDDEYRIKDLGVDVAQRWPNWNRDGTLIYYYRRNDDDSAGYDYYQLDVSRGILHGEEVSLTGLNTVDTDIFGVSPDGTRLAFSYAVGGSAGDVAAREFDQRIAYVPTSNRVTAPKDGSMDATGVVNLTTPKFDMSKWKPKYAYSNLKVSWVNNDIIRYIHHDHVRAPVASAHTHLLDTRKSPDDPGFDRIICVGNHPIPHPSGKSFISRDTGLTVNQGPFWEDGHLDLRGQWGLYDVETLKRIRLPIQSRYCIGHPDFSPDGKHIVFDMAREHKNWITIHRMWSNDPPMRLVEHGMEPFFSQGEPYWHVNPHWSPDGTKLHYRSTAGRPPEQQAGKNTDVFMVVFKRPDPITDLTVRVDQLDVHLGWKPAAYHYETKEYHILRAASADGPFVRVGTVPQRTTSLAANCATSDKSIITKSTNDFPATGLLELAPVYSTDPSEVVAYQKKTPDGFEGLTRSTESTEAAIHFRDTFVWLYPAEDYFTDIVPATGTYFYKVQSVEWSGLKGELSFEPLTVDVK